MRKDIWKFMSNVKWHLRLNYRIPCRVNTARARSMRVFVRAPKSGAVYRYVTRKCLHASLSSLHYNYIYNIPASKDIKGVFKIKNEPAFISMKVNARCGLAIWTRDLSSGVERFQVMKAVDCLFNWKVNFNVLFSKIIET